MAAVPLRSLRSHLFSNDVGAKQFARKVDFSGQEEHLVTIADTGAITGNLDNAIYRNIASWWPTGLNIIPRLDDGAGQDRPYSRPGLCHHYSRADSSVMQSLRMASSGRNEVSLCKSMITTPRLVAPVAPEMLAVSREFALRATVMIRFERWSIAPLLSGGHILKAFLEPARSTAESHLRLTQKSGPELL